MHLRTVLHSEKKLFSPSWAHEKLYDKRQVIKLIYFFQIFLFWLPLFFEYEEEIAGLRNELTEVFHFLNLILFFCKVQSGQTFISHFKSKVALSTKQG